MKINILDKLESLRDSGKLQSLVTSSEYKYQESKEHKGFIEQIDSDGNKKLGRIVDGEFVEEEVLKEELTTEIIVVYNNPKSKNVYINNLISQDGVLYYEYSTKGDYLKLKYSPHIMHTCRFFSVNQIKMGYSNGARFDSAKFLDGSFESEIINMVLSRIR